ncbi:uncharacterized protein LOC116416909 [Nasonia vitripennis]|uniref:RNA-directed DNA polymerase n=1 Tax=Nasonia vitripennis TaxID=7425 RepID=A0A7M7T8U0_NASVI|nr:uncharacterized protein LOC116416909 [Nasonia vitripennis]
MDNHRKMMDALRKDREVRNLASEIRKYDKEDVEEELKSLKISTKGNKAILRDRLLRAEILRAGLSETVPWYEWDNGGVIPTDSEEALTAILNHKKSKSRTSSKRDKKEMIAESASQSEIETGKETEYEAGDESLEEIVNSSVRQIQALSSLSSTDDGTPGFGCPLTVSNQLQQLISARVLSALQGSSSYATSQKSIDPTYLLFVNKTTRAQPEVVPVSHLASSPALDSNEGAQKFMGIWPYAETIRNSVQPNTGTIKESSTLRRSISDDGKFTRQVQEWELRTPKSKNRPHVQPTNLKSALNETEDVERKKPTEPCAINQPRRRKITVQNPGLPWFARGASKKPAPPQRAKKSSDSSSDSEEDSSSDESEKEESKNRALGKTPTKAIDTKSKQPTRESLKKEKSKKKQTKRDSSSSSSDSSDSLSSQENDFDSSSSSDRHERRKTTSCKKKSSRRLEQEERLANHLYQLQIIQGRNIKFAGETRDDPEEYLSQIQECKESLNLKSEEILAMIPHTLSKKASMWFRTEKEGLKTWKTFKKAFEEQFISEVSDNDVIEELRRRTQGKGEKISTYIMNFKYIAAHLKRPMRLKDQLTLLTERLRPEYRRAIRRKKIESYEDVKRYCRTLEEEMERDAMYTPPPTVEKSRFPAAAWTPTPKAKVAAAKEVEEAAGVTDANSNKQNINNNNKNKKQKQQQNPPLVTSASITDQPVNNNSTSEPKQTNNGPPVWRPVNVQSQRQTQQSQGRADASDATQSQPLSRYNNRGSTPFVGACYHCQQVGHRASACPTPGPDPVSSLRPIRHYIPKLWKLRYLSNDVGKWQRGGILGADATRNSTITASNVVVKTPSSVTPLSEVVEVLGGGGSGRGPLSTEVKEEKEKLLPKANATRWPNNSTETKEEKEKLLPKANATRWPDNSTETREEKEKSRPNANVTRWPNNRDEVEEENRVAAGEAVLNSSSNEEDSVSRPWRNELQSKVHYSQFETQNEWNKPTPLTLDSSSESDGSLLDERVKNNRSQTSANLNASKTRGLTLEQGTLYSQECINKVRQRVASREENEKTVVGKECEIEPLKVEKSEKRVSFELESEQSDLSDDSDLVEVSGTWEDTPTQVKREKIIELIEEEEDFEKLSKIELAVEQLQSTDIAAENQSLPETKEIAEQKKPIPPDPNVDYVSPPIQISDEVEHQAPTAAVITDNRNYMQVVLSGTTYRALFDPGAVITLVGPRVAEKFENRLIAAKTSIQAITGELSPVMGYLQINIELDGIDATITARAVKEIGHDVVFGRDFCEIFKIDTDHRGWWRANGGIWRRFNSQNPSENDKVFAECTGITELDEDERRQIEEIVDGTLPEYSPDVLGFTDLTEHHISLTCDTPVRQKFRRRSPKKIESIQKGAKELERLGIIERSASDFVSQVVMVPKQGTDEERLCVDFTDVNKFTKKDGYPLPQMDAILDRLRCARYLSKIDLRQAYFQVKMEESSKKYTAFAVPGYGLWQFTRMPFGLINAPMTLQRLVDTLFGPEDTPQIFGYLDDIVIATDSFEEHKIKVRYVLQKLISAGLTINPKKCQFCVSQIKYLGFVLDKDGLRTDPDKVAPVLNCPAPCNVRELRRVLGMIGWYARFIENSSETKIPLVKLLRKDQKWTWGDEQQQAFEKLKKALTVAPVLARPDFNKPFCIQCDASNVAIGAVLTQEFDDGEHPIVYVSRVLTAAEKNYTTTERECLALVWAIKKLRPYVEGYHFTVITDHSALRWLRSLKEPSGRLARWALEVQQWDFDIIHRRGANHRVPDALSRMLEPELAAVAEISDPWYLRRFKEVEEFPNKFPQWRVEDGRLYRFKRDPLLDPITHSDEAWKLVIPAEQREKVMTVAHVEVTAGHMGIEKTYDRIAREYFWPGMYHDVHSFITACPVCQRYKVSQQGPQGLIGKRIVEKPWTVVAADMMEFPRSKGQNKYLLVFQDLFTRWVEVKPLRKADGKSVARAFEELVLFRWETPEYLLTDNGTEFLNKHVAETLKEYGVTHVTTPPYHPQANPVERSNRTLKTMIAMFAESHRDWDKHVHELRHAMNTAVQSTLKTSPAFLNFGRHPSPVKSLRTEIEGRGPKLQLDPAVWQDRMKRLDALRELVAKFIDNARNKQGETYNRRRRLTNFAVGDMVLRRTHYQSKAAESFSAKLAPKFEGPFRITEQKSPTVYILEAEEGNSRKIAKAHVSDLKRYLPPRNPKTNSPNTDPTSR